MLLQNSSSSSSSTASTSSIWLRRHLAYWLVFRLLFFLFLERGSSTHSRFPSSICFRTIFRLRPYFVDFSWIFVILFRFCLFIYLLMFLQPFSSDFHSFQHFDFESNSQIFFFFCNIPESIIIRNYHNIICIIIITFICCIDCWRGHGIFERPCERTIDRSFFIDYRRSHLVFFLWECSFKATEFIEVWWFYLEFTF